jgi:hypothetical protein
MAKPVSPQEMFDAWQKMFAPGTMPMGSLMFPDLKDVEKKISELETVESWLKANLNMLQMSIKSLEYQRSMLKGGEKAKAVLADSSPKETPGNPAQWAWDMMTQGAPRAAAKKRRK